MTKGIRFSTFRKPYASSDAQLDRVVRGLNASVAKTVLNRVEDVPRVTAKLFATARCGLAAVRRLGMRGQLTVTQLPVLGV